MVTATPAAKTTLPHFDIFTRQLEAMDGFDDGEMRLKATASSSMTDLSGDEIKLPALQRMMEQAVQGMPVFFNHSYKIPEDVAGYIESAEIHPTEATDEHGEAIYDVDVGVLMDKENPRSVQTHKSLAGGAKVKAKLGISIGALIKHATKKKAGGYIIDDIEWLEASIVGIPQNRRSWTHYAAKALADFEESLAKVEEATHDEVVEEEDALEKAWSSAYIDSLPDSAFACIDSSGRHYPHHSRGGAVDREHVANALARLGDKSNTQCGKAHIEAHARALGMGDREKAVDSGDVAPLERQDLYSHTHDHAHGHSHEHIHADGLTHEHDHVHIHEHDHGHGGPEEHHGPPDDAMNSPEHDHDHFNDSDEHAHTKSLTKAGGDLEDEEKCPTCGGSRDNPVGKCSDDFHDGADQEPDNDADDVMDTNISASITSVPSSGTYTVAQSNVTIAPELNITTPMGVQEAPQGASPESTPATIPGQSEVAEGIGGLVKHLRTLMELNDSLIAENVGLKKDLLALRTERDEAVENLRTALNIVERLNKLPLPAKTRGYVEAAKDEFSERFSMYDPAIVKRLSKE